jgi:hypothetical protein
MNGVKGMLLVQGELAEIALPCAQPRVLPGRQCAQRDRICSCQGAHQQRMPGGKLTDLGLTVSN